MFELAKPDFLLRCQLSDTTSLSSADGSTLFPLRNLVSRPILRGSVGVGLSALLPACLQTLAALTDSSPPATLEDVRPPLEGGDSIRRRVDRCPFHTAGGWCVCGWGGVPCASERGERIMGKQRASLPLATLHCPPSPHTAGERRRGRPPL